MAAEMIYLDFETRSTLELKRVGAWKYSLHPDTEVLCMGYKHEIRPGRAYATNLITSFGTPIIPENQPVKAHNAGFEYAIWHNIMVPRYGWPRIPAEQWFCSAAQAAYHGLPRKLEDAAQALGLDVQKDAEGSRLMKQMSKPRPQWKKTGEGPKWFEDDERLERLYEYCKRDVEVEYALSQALDELPQTERRIWMLDQVINRRGIYCDVELAQSAITIIEDLEDKACAELRELTDGEISTPGQTDKIIDWLVGENLAIPNMQALIVEEFLQRDDLTPKARRILEIRQLHSKASTKKYQAMLESADDDQRMRGLLLYHGAHTSRWTGKRVQPTNFIYPKFSRSEVEHLIIPAIKNHDIEQLEFLFGDPINPLSSALRATMCAAPGKDLIAADYAGIENRVLLWRAVDTVALAKKRAGIDLYVDMACAIFGCKYDELKTLVNKSNTDAVFKRFVGKRAVLGAGYQMGAPRFRAQCAEKGVEIDEELAEKTIRAYRRKYNKIAQYWYRLNDLALERTGPFSMKGKFLQFKMKSGALLNYYDPRITTNRFGEPTLSYMGVDAVSRKWVRMDTYGGKLTENEIQKLSRDIMVGGMMRAEAARYPIIFNVYDELIAEVDKDFGSVDEFVGLLCQQPPWAEGCPISAEGWRGERYRK
jgi:DNA polymerase